ncbi:hypothetical protein BU16DRAFT_563306 [Lophium mytilinum]|uniref:C2H2-type domain-containing protein n=1 Tax=Lophium mytilinum TaxID=390894 RepID=A0A6A6QLW2_9PEZI|nr:hypothetical protein BU16DRAFT_563306 [Lophium mytilinum]
MSPRDYFAKEWPTAFSTRTIQRNVVKEERSINAEGKGALLFLCDTKHKAPSRRVQAVGDFCRNACLDDIKRGLGPGGQCRTAWLDDRSFPNELNEPDALDAGELRTCANPLTATSLYHHLNQPRFGNGNLPDADRRVIYISNLDPSHVLVLAETAAYNQAKPLRDAFVKHMGYETSIRVNIPYSESLPSFQLELHLPFFAFKQLPSSYVDSWHTQGSNTIPTRSWIDLSFLSNQTSNLEKEPPYGIYKARSSFMICGSNDRHWTGYAFVDRDMEDEEESTYNGLVQNRITGSPSNVPVWDPREYFLIVLDENLLKVQNEWEDVVFKVAQGIESHRYHRSDTMPRDRGITSHGDFEKALDWTNRTISLLSHLTELLSDTVDAWEKFKNLDRDIDYFYDSSEASLKSSKSKCNFSEWRARQSVRSISEKILELKRLQNKLRLLSESCDKSVKDLKLRQAIEIRKASQHTGLTAEFTVLVLYPFTLVLAFFYMPQASVPFTLSFKYFVVSIFVFMAAMVAFKILFVTLSGMLQSWWRKGPVTITKGFFERLLLRKADDSLPFSNEDLRGCFNDSIHSKYSQHTTPNFGDPFDDNQYESLLQGVENGEPPFLDSPYQRNISITTKALSSTQDYPNPKRSECSYYEEPNSGDDATELQEGPPNQSYQTSLELEKGTECSPITSEPKASHERQPALSTTSTIWSGVDSDYDCSIEEGPCDISVLKEEIIDRVMIQFYRMFYATLGSRGAASGEPNSAHGDPLNYGGTSSSGSSQHNTGKRKTNRDRNRRDSDEEDGNLHKRSKPHKDDDDLESDRRLACPYFKHNPSKYRDITPCRGPGWTELSRLKEHIYRCHSLPPRCTRCCQIFKSESDVTAHSRLPEGCEVRDGEPPEGIDGCQIQKLRSKKRGQFSNTREDRWSYVYSVLFPNMAIPSPYYDYEEDFGQKPTDSLVSARLARYDAFLKRHLPNIVRQELQTEMEKELSVIDENLTNKLPNIVESCLERLCRMFQGVALAEQPIQNEGLTHERGTNVSGSAEAVDVTPFPHLSCQANLGSYQIPPEVSPDFNDEFMASFDMTGSGPPDSAYWSQGWPRETNPPMGESDILFSGTDHPRELSFSGFGLRSPRAEETQTSTYSQNEVQNFESFNQHRSSHVGKGKGKAKGYDASEW